MKTVDVGTLYIDLKHISKHLRFGKYFQNKNKFGKIFFFCDETQFQIFGRKKICEKSGDKRFKNSVENV